jgi:hypothetical protein
MASFSLSIWQALAMQRAEAAPDLQGATKVNFGRPIETNQASRLDFKDAPVRIRLEVTPIKQDKKNNCWATVYAMMLSWKIGKPVSVDTAVMELGAPYTKYLSDDKGLPGGKEVTFVKAVGLRAMPPASYPLTDFRRILRTRGPVWINTGDGFRSHARLLIGLYGVEETEKRSTYENTILELIDPASGEYLYKPALKFYEEFEREAREIVDAKENGRELRWQLISY